MYGAKAIQIAKVAWDTWGPRAPMSEAEKRDVEAAVYVAASKGLTMRADDFGKAFPEDMRHTAFVRLCQSLANNPLVA